MSLSGEGPSTADPVLLTTSEFAERCDVSPVTVRAWVRQGRLKPDWRRNTDGLMKFDERKVSEFVHIEGEG